MRAYLGIIALVAASMVGADVALAEEATTAAAGNSLIAIGAGLAIGLSIMGCALGQGKGLSAALDSIGRNPAAAGKLQLPLILGLVFIEALGIISFVIANSLASKI